MSRKRNSGQKRTENLRRRGVRKRRAMRQDLERQLAQIQAEGPISAGMSRAEALKLVAQAAEEIAHAMAVGGQSKRVPWGVMFDVSSIEETMRNGLKAFEAASRAMDEVDEDQASEAELLVHLANLVGAAMTVGGAAVLYLGSSPIPFDVAKLAVASRQEGTPRAEGGAQP